jgi:xylulokinase
MTAKMMQPNYVLIINLGLKSIRSIVFNEKGEAVKKYWLPVKTIIDGPFIEQDPNEWWEQAKAVIKASLTEEIKEKIGYISVTSSSCCLVMLDEKDQCVNNSIMVSDKRAHEQAKLLKTDERFSFLFKNQNHLAEPSYMFPKIMWLKENKAEVFTSVAKFMSSDDFLIYHLTGRFVTDYLNAEKFYYDISSGSYPGVLLEHLGMSESMLPKVVEIGDTAGMLKQEVKEEMGLKQDVRVVVSTYDAICAVLGAGVSEEGEVSHVCGTCSSFRVYSNKKISAGMGILAQPMKAMGMYIVGGSNNIEGGVLEWAKDCFYGDSYPLLPVLFFALLEAGARQSTLGARGLIFIPYLLGERVPFWDPDVRAVFFGLERNHTRKDIMRSIFETAGFNALNMLKAIEKSGVPVKRIRISGGLSRIDYICKLKADITGREVVVLEEFETTAVGAFMAAAVNAGLFPDLKSAASVVKIKKVIKPDMKAHKKYQKLQKLYMEIYKSSSKVFRKRKKYLDAASAEKYSVITNL